MRFIDIFYNKINGGLKSGKPFYITVSKKDEKIVEVGITFEDLSTEEKTLDFLDKLNKMGSYPEEIWYCQRIFSFKEPTEATA